MSRLPFEVGRMFIAPGIRKQMLDAVEKLRAVLPEENGHKVGIAYKVCDTWQQRFELALRSEIPDWIGLAGFRCITDFVSDRGTLEKLILPPAHDSCDCGKFTEDDFKNVDTAEKFWCAYRRYFENHENLLSGKLTVGGDIEKILLSSLNSFDPVLGGQAGNINWLWHCIGSDPIAYTPYFFKRFATLPEKTALDEKKKMSDIKYLRLLCFEKGQGGISKLKDMKGKAGVLKSDNSLVGAPSGGSVIVAEKGRRLIYQFKGNRDLEKPFEKPCWDEVQFFHRNKFLNEPIQRSNDTKLTWPGIGLFGECSIEDKTLIIRLAEEEEIETALKGKTDFAVIGGIDSIFKDDWLKKDKILQARLLEVAEKQLKAMAACGIRIGVELSGVPAREYADFIQRLCKKGIIVALGINGEDELPHVVGEECVAAEQKLYDFWLDPESVNDSLKEKLKPEVSIKDGKKTYKYRSGDHFEYLTYLRAMKLAEATGVRTLYVHANTLDFILRRDADPGSLFRAQQGDMMGKGLVIAALMKRAYGNDWLKNPDFKKMTPAVSPDGMAKLGGFVNDFVEYKNKESDRNRLLHSGYWLAPSPDQYSFAVVPVMWPHISKTGLVRDLPEKLNTTGAGDMTFGAFFLLGGV